MKIVVYTKHWHPNNQTQMNLSHFYQAYITSIPQKQNQSWSSILGETVNLACQQVAGELIFYIRYNNLCEMLNKLQACGQCASSRQLQKATSMPSFTETAASSSNSIDGIDDQYRKRAIRWIFAYNKKVSRDTQYMAVAYLNYLPRKSFPFAEDNYELFSIALLLLACKMNEVHPPKIAMLMEKSRRSHTKEAIIIAEQRILIALDFNIALDNTIYTRVHNILGFIYADQLHECDKLLRMVLTHREIYQFGEEILSYATVYLVKPQFVRDMRLRQQIKVKNLAVYMYNLYNDARSRHERHKENRPRP